MFEVDGNMGDGSGNCDAGAGQQIELPRLRRGVIHLKDLQPGIRVAVGESIQSSSQQHVLPDASLHRVRQKILCIPRSGDQESAQRSGGVAFRRAKLITMRPQNALRKGVVEENRVVDGLMCGAPQGNSQGRSRWYRGLHLVTDAMVPCLLPLGLPAAATQKTRLQKWVYRGYKLLRLHSLAYAEDRRRLLVRLSRVQPRRERPEVQATLRQMAQLLRERFLPEGSSEWQPFETPLDARVELAYAMGGACQTAAASAAELRWAYRRISACLRMLGV